MTPCEELGYKVGDKFEVLLNDGGFKEGQIVTLYRDEGDAVPLFAGDNDIFNSCDGNPGTYLTLQDVRKIVEDIPSETPFVEDTSKYHVHHDLIIAWAKGEQIQYYYDNGNYWIDVKEPNWHSDNIYRIKPSPNADVVIDKHCFIDEDAENAYTVVPDVNNPANVRFIFDGETRELKDVEFLGE